MSRRGFHSTRGLAGQAPENVKSNWLWFFLFSRTAPLNTGEHALVMCRNHMMRKQLWQLFKIIHLNQNSSPCKLISILCSLHTKTYIPLKGWIALEVCRFSAQTKYHNIPAVSLAVQGVLHFSNVKLSSESIEYEKKSKKFTILEMILYLKSKMVLCRKHLWSILPNLFETKLFYFYIILQMRNKYFNSLILKSLQRFLVSQIWGQLPHLVSDSARVRVRRTIAHWKRHSQSISHPWAF